jgi:hypothetical protein
MGSVGRKRPEQDPREEKGKNIFKKEPIGRGPEKRPSRKVAEEKEKEVRMRTRRDRWN